MLPAPAANDARAFNHKLVALGDPERVREMQGWRAAWEGVELTNRPSFWDNVPIRDKQPLIRAQLARTAGERLIALVFGERGFPTIAAAAEDYAVKLSDTDRETLAACILEIVGAMNLKTAMPSLLDEGLKVASACCVVTLDDGMLGLEFIAAEWCTPTLDKRGRCTSLVVQYKVPAGLTNGVQQWEWYRREITATYDRTYHRAAWDEVKTPDWSRVPIQRETATEFCAAVWHRSQKSATTAASSIDGEPLMRGFEDEIEALDMTYSMRVRTGYYNGDPKLVRMGVDGDAPSVPMGQSSRDNFGYTVRDGGTAIKAGPGQIWNLPAEGDAKMLESTGAGANILDGGINALRRVLCDGMGVLLADPETLGKGDISARALTLMYGPMLNVADRLRSECGETLCEILSHALRLLTTKAATDRGVYLSTYEAVKPVLMRCYRKVATEGGIEQRWFSPKLDLKWGAYFTPSIAEIKDAISAMMEGTGGKPVVTTKQAVELLAAYLPIEDAEAAHKALADEAATAAESLNSTMSALAGNRDEPQTTEPTSATDSAPAPVVENAKDPSTALNGAQVTAMLAIVQAVAGNALPRDSGVAMLTVAFPITRAMAEEVMGTAGQTFTTPAPIAQAPTVHVRGTGPDGEVTATDHASATVAIGSALAAQDQQP